jgi:trimeric autotransporter adhesin
MKKLAHSLPALLGLLLLSSLLSAQQAAISTTSVAVVPRLVNFSGKATDAQGKAVAGVAGVTFAIYGEQNGGAPLWMETQNITADSKGSYTAQLGVTKPAGIPLELFSTGEARWLGVRVNGGEEQPRVLLLSVPYALKAADAETIGGLPPSAFMLAAPPIAGGGVSGASPASAPDALPPFTGSGTTSFLPIWTSASALGSSALFETGSGSSVKVGINTTTPQAMLDVRGSTTIRATLNLPATATAKSSGGANSAPLSLVASAFNSGSSTATNEVFHWMAEPAGNNTSSPSATLNLLFATAPSVPAETGLKINSLGQITFAPGQTFPGGSGTVTSVGLSAPSSDFTVSGSPVTSSGTLALNWNTAPTNADTANAIVKRDGNGAFSAGTITGTSTNAFGVIGQSTNSVGVGAISTNEYGLQANSVSSLGVFGESGTGYAIEGYSSSNYGIVGISGTTAGILGVSDGSQSTATGFGPDGIVGEAISAIGTGIVAINTNAGGDAFLAINQGSSTGPAAFFVGSVDIDGSLSKSSGTFKIDHPLDPANKYLYHSFVESPDMMNIYNGVATLDEKGQATVALPDWFESLNQDYRYQLTAIGAPGPNLHIAAKVQNNSFKIGGGQPGMEVSWQVTGIRHDAWANAHRVQVEVEKPGVERGTYIHPELFGAPKEKSLAMAHHPELNRAQVVKAAKSHGAAK